MQFSLSLFLHLFVSPSYPAQQTHAPAEDAGVVKERIVLVQPATLMWQDMPLTRLAQGIEFPVTFSINQDIAAAIFPITGLSITRLPI